MVRLFLDRERSRCRTKTTIVQKTVRCLADLPCQAIFGIVRPQTRGILHQAIILDVPSSRSSLNKKISMRLHRR